MNEQIAQFGAEAVAVGVSGEVMLLVAPRRNGVDHPGNNLARRRLASGTSEWATKVFGNDHVGRRLRPFARYFDVDVVLVRILWLLLIFWPIPIGLIGYIIAWIVMPRDPLPIPATAHTAGGHA